MQGRIERQYPIVYQDPAWRYNHKRSVKDGGMAYETMDLKEIKRLDIGRLVTPGGYLITWFTSPKMEEQMDVLRAWGIQWVTILFEWIKLNELATITTERVRDPKTRRMKDVITIDGGFKSGTGRHTNSNVEHCVLGWKPGKPRLERQAKNIKQLVFAPIGAHSAKPPLYDRIEALYGRQDSLELWARPNPFRPAHWDATGFQLDGQDIRDIVGFQEDYHG